MNKSIYLRMSILDISKTLMYELWYDYIKPKYQRSYVQEETKPCYMDTESYVIYIKTEDFYEDIANDIEKWFDTSNYDKNDKRPLPIGKNKKVIGLFKDELGGNIVKELTGSRKKTYACLMGDNTKY